MVTKAELENLHFSGTLHHVSVKAKSGAPLQCRRNGKLKTWKTRPDEFKLPVKYGLYDYFYITEVNAGEWVIPTP